MENNRYTYQEFDVLFRKYWEKIYSICYRYMWDKDAAKDMVQNIFITLWQKKEAVRNEQSLEKYLTKAVKYQVFKRLRYQKKVILGSDDLMPDMESRYPNPYQHCIYRELVGEIENEISKLQEPAKTIFRMSRYDVLSHREIAQQLGLAVKTVEYHLTRSRWIIRQKIKEH